MKLQLVFKTAKSGKKTSRTYDVDLPIVIGRGQRASFRIPHGQISRCHCELLESKGSVFVRDLGSTNGTMVKGTMLPSKTKTPSAYNFNILFINYPLLFIVIILKN